MSEEDTAMFFGIGKNDARGILPHNHLALRLKKPRTPPEQERTRRSNRGSDDAAIKICPVDLDPCCDPFIDKIYYTNGLGRDGKWLGT